MKDGANLRAGSSRPFRRGHRVVVTGGAGFVGSHRCDQLIQRGDVIICFDNPRQRDRRLKAGSRREREHI
jgi:UDP-glucuronate decarboxylase